MYELFGQIPDVLEDVWVQVAQREIEKAKQTIGKIPEKHPFELRYHKIQKTPWESCSKVLEHSTRRQQLLRSW